MVELSSRLWKEYRHAYGPATDIPDLLRQARHAPRTRRSDEEPWFSLWSALCHQDDVYSGSIAALPHLIEIASERLPLERRDALLLAGAIETYRHRPGGPDIPSYLEVTYRTALSRAADLTVGALNLERDGASYAGLLAALAAFQGHPRLAAGINNMEPRMICPNCDKEFETPGFDLFA
jgi:hypothetical protein